MKLSKAFPSQWLKAADLQGKTWQLVIREIKMEDVSGEGSDKEDKPIVYFKTADDKNLKKGLVLNKTNGTALAVAYGDETDEWIGCPIELFTMQVQYQGQMVPAIRVRVPEPAAEDGESSDEPPF